MVGDELRNLPYQWSQLKREYVFTTAQNARNYNLPGDFYRLIEATQWDITNQWPLNGPSSDAVMASMRYGVVGLSNRKFFRIIGPVGHLISTSPYSKRTSGTFQIDPAGDNDTDQLYMPYMSCNWIWPRDWVASTAYSAGDIRSVNGYVYICKTSGTSGTTRPTTSTVDTDITDNTAVWRVYNEPYSANASNSKLNDADLCVFDKDIMTSGLEWMYLREKRMEFLDLQSEWNAKVARAYGRFNGVTRFSMSKDEEDDGELPLVPDGGWSV